MRTSPTVKFPGVTFTGADIRDAIVIENVDPISATVPSGTLELTLYSENPNFSIITPTGDYASLANRQSLAVSEIVGNETRFIGQFYLDTWENLSDRLIKFNAIDLLGVLATVPYDGGIWLTPVPVEYLFSRLLDRVGVNFILDPDLASVELSGWIPSCTTREAIQQVAFAAGAYVTCARQAGGSLKIGKSFLDGAISRGIRCGANNYSGEVVHCGQGPLGGVGGIYGQTKIRQKRFRQGTWGELVAETTITKAEKGISSPLALRKLVTGVEVTAHSFSEGAGSLELYKGTLAVGSHKIVFKQPMHSLTVTGATIEIAEDNYALLNVAVEGTVILTGHVYIDATKKFSVYTDPPVPDVNTNIMEIKEATLVSPANGQATAQRVYSYYEQRLLQKTKLFRPVVVTGNTVLIDSLYSQKIRGVVEKMTLDLARGYTAQVDIVGIVYVP